MIRHLSPMPPMRTSRWFNTLEPITLDALRGRVVVVHAFQMLCPGCVAHSLPQAVRLREAFSEDQLAVIGLHTVFEHHEVMGAEALKAFIHEYRLSFPIGVDEADPSQSLPRTMAAWNLQGTPSLVVTHRRRVDVPQRGNPIRCARDDDRSARGRSQVSRSGRP